MPVLQMMITDAGLDALVAAETAATDPIQIATLGLTDTPFVMAPTLTALPGQFKALVGVSGQEVAPNVIHVTAYDTSADIYDLTGFGLFLDDGTLFAVYSHATDPVLSKAELAFGLISVDVAFTNNAAANIEFGSALFLYPPASETVAGIAKFASQAEVDAVVEGPDDYRETVTTKTLRARLTAFLAPITASLDALLAGLATLTGRTITGGGIATGGGDLSANRVITVTAALEADLETANTTKALVPALLGLVRLFGANGRFRLFGFEVKWGSFSIGANTTMTVTFPVAFSGGQCFAALAQGSGNDIADQDNYVHAVAGSQSASGFTAFNGHGAMTGNYIAIGS